MPMRMIGTQRSWAALATILLYATTVVAVVTTSPPTARITSHYEPSADAARQNAFHIFNAVHSAMRQWGSSIKHNGLSFFIATVPEGQLFYHGTHQTERPVGFEWLAFEVEHAAQFGRSWDPHQPPYRLPNANESKPSAAVDGGRATVPSSIPSSVEEALVLHGLSHDFPGFAPEHDKTTIDSTAVDQKRLGGIRAARINGEGDDYDPEKDPRRPNLPTKALRGYVHTYRAARPLNLLYLDGMAAAKFTLGSLDTQDLILRGLDGSGPDDVAFAEMQRAKEICGMLDEWALDDRRIDGFVRMESGFEIVYCHFEEGKGLDLVNVNGSPFSNQTSTLSMMGFEWLRAAAQRYDGMPAGRIEVDFSSMVSAFAYPMNITNPDPARPELPRLINATPSERHALFSRLREVSQERYLATGRTVNWQGVADMIVSRFSNRLWQYVNTNVTAEYLLSDIGTLINPFIDYRDAQPASASAVSRCSQHYLDPALLQPSRFTPEDDAIHAAIEAVSEHICTALFDAHRILFDSKLSKRSSPRQKAADEAQDIIRGLVERLDWPIWKECGRCEKPEEICFVAMYPIGGPEDHFAPRCKNSTLVLASMEYFLDIPPSH